MTRSALVAVGRIRPIGPDGSIPPFNPTVEYACYPYDRSAGASAASPSAAPSTASSAFSFGSASALAASSSAGLLDLSEDMPVLEPRESVLLPVYIRAATLGEHNIGFMLRYEAAGTAGLPSSAAAAAAAAALSPSAAGGASATLRYRLLHMQSTVSVRPAISAAHSVRPGQLDVRQSLVGLAISNETHGNSHHSRVPVCLHRVSVLSSAQWVVGPLRPSSSSSSLTTTVTSGGSAATLEGLTLLPQESSTLYLRMEERRSAAAAGASVGLSTSVNIQASSSGESDHQAFTDGVSSPLSQGKRLLSFDVEGNACGPANTPTAAFNPFGLPLVGKCRPYGHAVSDQSCPLPCIIDLTRSPSNPQDQGHYEFLSSRSLCSSAASARCSELTSGARWHLISITPRVGQP